MSHKTAIKIYEIASYVLILGATAIYFWLKQQGLSLTMLILALAIFCRWMMGYMEKYQDAVIDILGRSRFRRPARFSRIRELAGRYLGVGNKMGEGWLLTGEMLELIHSGVPNIVCAQPFGCLPNHIVGKGMMKPLKEKYPNANIVAVDYDAGATKINQENRIKLMLANAKNAAAPAKPVKTADDRPEPAYTH